MATGTGKTRTSIGLIDLFLKTNQAQKILFLADRDALVDQTLNEGFRQHLPNEPNDRIFTHSIDKTKRLYVATLHTIGRCFEEFSPAFFDLIIFDEADRSIFNKLGEVIQYFDARMIGLTATPADFVDRDTFLLFDCPDGIPTFCYSYKKAIDEKILVDYSLYKAQTNFQREGIKGIDLTEEEQNLLIEQGTNVSPTLLKEFPMMLPPLPLQEKFAEIVQKFERVRRQQREAARQAEHLFQTLLHRAFRGEL